MGTNSPDSPRRVNHGEEEQQKKAKRRVAEVDD
jgi:hypothetical protein